MFFTGNISDDIFTPRWLIIRKMRKTLCKVSQLKLAFVLSDPVYVGHECWQSTELSIPNVTLLVAQPDDLFIDIWISLSYKYKYTVIYIRRFLQLCFKRCFWPSYYQGQVQSDSEGKSEQLTVSTQSCSRNDGDNDDDSDLLRWCWYWWWWREYPLDFFSCQTAALKGSFVRLCNPQFTPRTLQSSQFRNNSI